MSKKNTKKSPPAKDTKEQTPKPVTDAPDKAVIAVKSPAGVKLETGKDYYWCRCGRSKSQPFCDGSHKVTKLTPVKFTVKESKQYFLCQCKQTKTPPYCDGTHKTL